MNPKPFYPLKQEIQPLLEGRQTAIVRPVKIQPEDRGLRYEMRFNGTPGWEDWHGRPYDCPFGNPRTVLMCKEPFYAYDWYEADTERIEESGVLYRVDEPTNRPFGISYEACAHEYGYQNKDMWPRWKSGVIMPKSACRLWLEVVDVKVCRVFEVTNEMAVALGWEYYEDNDKYKHSVMEFKAGFWHQYGVKFYNTNPWIWYAAIKRIDKPENP
jgi:hypothetical protein